MPGSFPPKKDSVLLPWSITFLSGLSDPSPLGLTPAMVTSYTADQGTYASLMASVMDPSSRTKITIASKNEAKTKLQNSIRLLASVINGQATVTDNTKMMLGLPIRKKPTPVPAPATAPVAEIKSVSGWTANVAMHDANSTRRGLPSFAIGVVAFVYVGATPPVDTSLWAMHGTSGKTNFDVQFSSALAAGTRVWITAAWLGSRKQQGPCCQPISTTLQGGNIVPHGAEMKIAA